MTHPDIRHVMRTGYLNPPKQCAKYGRCEHCGKELYHDGFERVESSAGFFCSLACCHKYHKIKID